MFRSNYSEVSVKVTPNDEKVNPLEIELELTEKKLEHEKTIGKLKAKSDVKQLPQSKEKNQQDELKSQLAKEREEHRQELEILENKNRELEEDSCGHTMCHGCVKKLLCGDEKKIPKGLQCPFDRIRTEIKGPIEECVAKNFTVPGKCS
ncbi:hypothetical protein CAEBREN_17042 [Caenorhabditis brenneri]|uniref:RING-type domain-containing protein n=1 Tax=Caenorhabditis brenneri TaxID=135651 RepID=G0MUM1_CAEBE|nr:hypothetical protein CAEBREN_17042 [Caenorhabditis brenneri]